MSRRTIGRVSVCEKMGTGTGRVLNASLFFWGRPEPVPIFHKRYVLSPFHIS
jgi:hypothetical protein